MAARAGRRASGLAHPLAGARRRGRRWRCPPTRAQGQRRTGSASSDYAAARDGGLARARLRRDRDARGGRLGDRGAAGALARADGERRARPWPRRPARWRGPGRSGSSAARATTAATGWSPLGGWPTPGTRSRRSCCGPRTSSPPTRRPTWSDSRAPLRQVGPEEVAPALEGAGVIVDAIFGTGFSGAPRAPADAAIEAINGCGAPVVAADIASGVDASTGEVEGAAVRGRRHGELPRGQAGALDRAREGAHRRASRGRDRDPGRRAGRARGGRDRRRRARPRSAADAELDQVRLRPGAGGGRLPGPDGRRVHGGARRRSGRAPATRRWPCPPTWSRSSRSKLTEVMSRGFAGAEGRLAASSAEAILEAAERAAAVVLGPGLGRDEDSLELARAVARRIEAPLLIDADGLNAHAERLDSIAERAAPTVLTPHAGELGRLLGRESGEVAEHRLACAREAAERSGGDRGAQGRRLPGRRRRAARDQRRGQPRARHRRHRRRALGHDRGAARPRHGALRGHLRRRPRASARRQDRRAAAGRGRVGDRDRRDRRSAGGARRRDAASPASSAPSPSWTRARSSATAPGWPASWAGRGSAPW